MNLLHRHPKPPAAASPPSVLYRVDWLDKRGHHTDRDLTWREACAEYYRLDHIVGVWQPRITAQDKEGVL